jgi:hypothetical protein
MKRAARGKILLLLWLLLATIHALFSAQLASAKSLIVPENRVWKISPLAAQTHQVNNAQLSQPQREKPPPQVKIAAQNIGAAPETNVGSIAQTPVQQEFGFVNQSLDQPPAALSQGGQLEFPFVKGLSQPVQSTAPVETQQLALNFGNQSSVPTVVAQQKEFDFVNQPSLQTPVAPENGVVSMAGSGPASGYLEVSDTYASSKAVQNFNSSNPTDFIFDPNSGAICHGKRAIRPR